jgi:hypothetical protein
MPALSSRVPGDTRLVASARSDRPGGRRERSLVLACRSSGNVSNSRPSADPQKRLRDLGRPGPGPPVPGGSPAAQTHKRTGYAGTPAICRRFSKRLMGFEPTTFCMASRTRGAADRPEIPAKSPVSMPRAAAEDVRLSPRDHGGLRTESGLSGRGGSGPRRRATARPTLAVVVSVPDLTPGLHRAGFRMRQRSPAAQCRSHVMAKARSRIAPSVAHGKGEWRTRPGGGSLFVHSGSQCGPEPRARVPGGAAAPVLVGGRRHG